jgi:hypothetical protein
LVDFPTQSLPRNSRNISHLRNDETVQSEQ